MNIPPGRDPEAAAPDRRDLERHALALAFFNSLDAMPTRPRLLILNVLPTLATRGPDERFAVRLVPPEPPGDAKDKPFRRLVRAARAVHRRLVRHPFVPRNPGAGDRRVDADLAWTTEVRVEPAARRVELVFWDGLRPLMPELIDTATSQGFAQFMLDPPSEAAAAAAGGGRGQAGPEPSGET